jgi:glycosyltransferase involved in cell wall biosynthesis
MHFFDENIGHLGHAMQQPLISVALCTYNGEKYIAEQLDSIISQTYKNLEIIVVDDCSTDNTFEIVSAYAGRDSRIKCFENEVNLGFNKNFEKAVTLTTGDYTAISDQDDIWLPDKLQLLSDHIKDNWLIFSNSDFINNTDRYKLLNGFKLPPDYKGILLFNYVTGHTTLINREFLKSVLPFPDKGYYDWWMGFVASYHHKITFLDKVLTNHRVHADSVIKKRQDLGRAELEQYETVSMMLNNFVNYKNIKREDKIFIEQLHQAYLLKASKSSAPLVKMVYKYYPRLFPNQKLRKLLTRFFFALRFSKKINS